MLYYELPVYKDTYRLLQLVYEVTGKFPQEHKFDLGQDMKRDAFETLVHFYPEYISVMLPVCLVMDISAIRPEIYIHGWHELAKDKAYNRRIYAEVQKVVNEIILSFPITKNDLRRIELRYSHHMPVTRFSPAAIFILTLLRQQDNLDISMDLDKCRKLLQNVSEKLAENDSFIPAQKNTVTHDYKKTAVSPFAAS